MKSVHSPSFFSWFGYALPFQKRLQHIKNANFASVAIWLGVEEQMMTDARYDEMCSTIAAVGMSISSAHSPYKGCNAIWNGSDTEKERLRQELTANLKVCKDYQIPIMVMHLTEGNDPPEPNEDGLSLVRTLGRLAAEASVTIAIENTRKTSTLDFVLSRIESSGISFCYDSSHDFLYCEEPTLILRRWGHRLAYTHFSDNDGREDRHWLPGLGSIDWALIEKAFPKNYNKCISLEVFPKNANREPIDDFLKEAHLKGNWLEQALRK